MKDHSSGTYHSMITDRHAPTDGSMRTYPNTVADRYRLRRFYALISLFSHDRVTGTSEDYSGRNEAHVANRFGIQYLLKGIYVHSDLLYFHTEIKNQSNVPFDVDYITFKMVDKKVAKRTAIQEQVLLPVRAYNYVVRVAGKKTEQTVFCLPKFTIPDERSLSWR